jgi:hypothetical protein
MRRALGPLVLAVFVVGCSHRTAPSQEPSVVVTPRPAPPPPSVAPLAATYDNWLEAVEARDPTRIAAMLRLPLTVYYDDSWTGKRPASCAWVRELRTLTTPGERDRLADCIAQTVTHLREQATTIPTGTVDKPALERVEDAAVRELMTRLADDHRFIEGHAASSGVFDFALAIERGQIQADTIVLATINGC